MLKDILPTLPSATFLSKSLRQPKHQQLDFVRRRGAFYGQVSQNANSSVKRRGFTDKRYLTKRPKSGTTELLSQMARGGLTALGTRGRGPLSGRAWSAQSPSETGRGEPTTATPGRHFCGKASGQLSPRRLLSNISSNIHSDIPTTNRNQQQLDFVRRKGVFHGQVIKNDQLVREKVWFHGQTWTEAHRQTWTEAHRQTWTGVSRTKAGFHGQSEKMMT